jgi:uncharacterized membrane protein
MSLKIPQLVDEFKKKHSVVRNANIEHQQNLSRMDKLALWITEHVGSMGFFFIIFIWTVIWMGWNTLAPVATRFDPYPAFVLWLFISNVIQIFLMPLIMIGQNLQSAHAEVRAEVDFEINKKAEQEIETILTHLEEQDKMILQILQRLEANQKAEG